MFIYQAELWCGDCGEAIIDTLGTTKDTGDSDDYPQSVPNAGASDCPDHCGSGANCLNADTLSDGSKVGALLTEDLTSDGIEYVTEAVADGGLVAVEIWQEAFSWIDFD